MNTQLIPPNSTFSFTITQEHIGRLDKFLSSQFPLFSRSFFQQLITNKLVTINGKSAQRPSWRLKENDQVVVQFPAERIIAPSSKQIPDITIEIIATQEDFMVLNKPARLAVHPTNNEDPQFTLVDWLLINYPNLGNIGFSQRPGIIHRLDKDTSGVIILARTNHGHTQFGKMFQDRTIHKTYIAIAQGHPPASGTIDVPIGRNKFNKTRMATPPNIAGPERAAVTHYKVLEYFDDYSLVELKPITGRTHQIRVHLASIDHPILGDLVYG